MPQLPTIGRKTGLVIAIFTAICFAGSGPFVKPLLNVGWSPLAAVWMRATGAAVILLPIALIVTRNDLMVFVRRWKWLVGYGLSAIALTQAFYYSAVALMPVSVALLLQYLSPVLLLFIAWARTKHRPATLSLLGAGLSVAGLLLALDLASAGGINPLGVLAGVAAAGGGWGDYLIAEALPDDLPPVALAAGGLTVASLTVGLVGVTGLVPMEFHFGTVDILGGLPWWVSMGVVILFGTVFGYMGGILASKAIGSRLASFLGLLEVLVTMILSALMLSETPSIVQLLGAVLVVGGVVCVRLAPDTVTLEAPLGPVTAPITLPITLPPPSAAAQALALQEAEQQPGTHAITMQTGLIGIVRVDPERISHDHDPEPTTGTITGLIPLPEDVDTSRDDES